MTLRSRRSEDPRIAEAVEALRRHGALFAYLHGSRAAGTAREGSDVDIAAYFDEQASEAFQVLFPAGVDLLVLNPGPPGIRRRGAAPWQMRSVSCGCCARSPKIFTSC